MGMRPIQENSMLMHHEDLMPHSSTRHRMKKVITTIRSHSCSKTQPKLAFQNLPMISNCFKALQFGVSWKLCGIKRYNTTESSFGVSWKLAESKAETQPNTASGGS